MFIVFQRAQRRLLDIANKLGLSNTLVKYIEQTPSREKGIEPFDPLIGLPIQKQKIKYDAETGLPIRE